MTVVAPAEFDRRSIEMRVTDLLRQRFVNGELRPGARLTEEALARLLNVSRGPVRAALQRLEHEQLVVLRPYRGWEVAKLNARDAWELSTLRDGLEELGVRLAAEQIDSEGVRSLRAALARLHHVCANAEPPEVMDADFALHRVVMERSGNGRLQQSYLLLEQQFRLLISAVNTPFFRDPGKIARSHDLMIEAICEGNAHVAAEQCRKHHEQSIAASRAAMSALTP